MIFSPESKFRDWYDHRPCSTQLTGMTAPIFGPIRKVALTIRFCLQRHENLIVISDRTVCLARAFRYSIKSTNIPMAMTIGSGDGFVRLEIPF